MAAAALKLDSTISSPQDVQSLIDELRAYARWFSHNTVKQRLKVRGKTAEPELSPAARALVRELKPVSTASLDSLLATLDTYKSKAPLVTITLAAPPAAGIKKSLVGWCRDNLAPNVLVNFQFNAAILGGLVVRTSSRVFDWSFRRQILDNRSHFPEVLRRV
jgi:hypothetical protein